MRLGGLPGWTAWSASWLSTLLASLLAVLALGWLSSRSAEEALADALADHVAAQAGMAASVLEELPLETLAQLGEGRASAHLRQGLAELAGAGSLRDLAIFDPAGRQLAGARGGDLVAARAERDLIARAAAGQALSGTLYRDREGDLYLSGYAPIPGHPGWVLAVEGSGEILGAVDHLERLELAVGATVVLLAGLLGAVLAGWVVGPIRRLDRDLRGARPGDAPEVIAAAGPREVQGAALAARGLLTAIQERDGVIGAAHRRELEQVRRMAAEIAHEVRNPLNALSLTARSLADAREDERRERLAGRVAAQVEEIEGTVRRLVDVTRPLHPQPGPLDLAQLARAAAEDESEVGAMLLRVEGDPTLPVRSDAAMLAEVLRNLLQNARQAGASSATLTVGRRGGLAEIRVQDDGSGISEGQEESAFDWFHTTRAQGSGLGLPASRRIMEALGGTLQIESPRPARFLISLPVESP